MTNGSRALFDLMDRLRAKGEDFCVATIVRTADATSAKAGAKALVTADGTVHGFVGGQCVQGAVKRSALQALQENEPRLIRVKPKEEVIAPVDVDGVELHRSSCPSGGTVDIFLEPMRQAMQLIVCGASPVAASLIALARPMGYRIIAATPEQDWASLDGADLHLASYNLDEAGVSPRDAVVVATQGKRDREALAGSLASPAGYVGMVCSRRKLRSLKDQLGDKFPARRLDAISGPAGLDIKAIEPEEIALSILGEIVQYKRQAAETVPQSEETGSQRQSGAG
ncbi:MAG: XdhC/CoxI family protein [Pseudomonadota bacterium]